jgi:uroporphyrinogen-III synthase
MQETIDILSTRELNEELLALAAAKGIRIEVSPFIRIEPVESVELQQEVEAVMIMNATVVFTSANAVEAVYGYLSDVEPIWDIYCIGHATSDLVREYFPFSRLAGEADSATELADVILEEAEGEEIIFFCGDRRRDELPEKLRHARFDVDEIVVYQTITTPHKIKKHYHAVMFYSPSGAESFFEMNRLPPGTPLFAIGETTAAAIRKRCDNLVLTPDEPSKEEMVNLVLDYFN